MRDGQYIATVDTKAAAIAEIIRMMVGRTIYEEAPEIPEVADPNVVLDVRDRPPEVVVIPTPTGDWHIDDPLIRVTSANPPAPWTWARSGTRKSEPR